MKFMALKIRLENNCCNIHVLEKPAALSITYYSNARILVGAQ